MKDYTSYKKNLKAAFEASHCTINRIVADTQFSRNAVKDILNGKSNPRIETFITVCDAIGVDPSVIISSSTHQTLSEGNPNLMDIGLRLLTIIPDLNENEISYILNISDYEANTLIQHDNAAFAPPQP